MLTPGVVLVDVSDWDACGDIIEWAQSAETWPRFFITVGGYGGSRAVNRTWMDRDTVVANIRSFVSKAWKPFSANTIFVFENDDDAAMFKLRFG